MTDSPYWLTTERLALRRFTLDDLDWLAGVRSDPDVMRYVGGPQDRADSEELLQVRMVQYYDDHPGLGNWLTVENHASQRVLTKIGLHRNGERAFPHPVYASMGPMAWFERDRDEWLANTA